MTLSVVTQLFLLAEHLHDQVETNLMEEKSFVLTAILATANNFQNTVVTFAETT